MDVRSVEWIDVPFRLFSEVGAWCSSICPGALVQAIYPSGPLSGTTILLESLDRMNIMESNLFNNGVWYYGHSMGAFVGLRISKRRDQADWTAHLSGWVFGLGSGIHRNSP